MKELHNLSRGAVKPFEKNQAQRCIKVVLVCFMGKAI